MSQNPLKTGDKVPDIRFFESGGGDFSLHEKLSEKRLLLTFLRGTW